MNNNALKKIFNHPDKDEVISKLIIGISPKDINDWLKSKYTNVNETKFVMSEKNIKSFQTNYLDVYTLIREDITKSKTAVALNIEEELALSVQNNPTYKNKMLELAGKELDVKKMITNLCVAIETRLGQVFDEIQEDPRNINTRVDRLLIDYAETFGNILEKYYKFIEEPAANVVTTNNVTVNVMAQHISVFTDAVKETLSQMDLETSLYFMELYNEKIAKLKAPMENAPPNTEMRLAEVKLLNQTIDDKLNG